MKNKSCEIDSIPTDLLCKCIDHLLPVLTKLVNVSLQSGVFSQKWKVAIVKPLLKKLGIELISSSYRPISNLKFVSKLVESCAMDRLNRTLLLQQINTRLSECLYIDSTHVKCWF